MKLDRFKILSQDEIELIHESSLRLLSEVGIGSIQQQGSELLEEKRSKS